ncbi:hypothetical protein E1A91_D04G225500v1 [Gossypium mustelinum]|uniref:Uncharacterized protein n=1 Tax=Gossypium mustelinum TaxID=34275 RepID=A0A5D2VH51_GOSMU|nr:hypothetical protein E1A91_D04G225500v1 [Gossypium mustelinum]
MRSKNSEIVLGVWRNDQLIPIFSPIFPLFLTFFSPLLATLFPFFANIFPSLLFFLPSASFLCFLQSMALPFIHRLSLSIYIYILSIFSSNFLALGNQIPFFVFLLFLFFFF